MPEQARKEGVCKNCGASMVVPEPPQKIKVSLDKGHRNTQIYRWV